MSGNYQEHTCENGHIYYSHALDKDCTYCALDNAIETAKRVVAEEIFSETDKLVIFAREQYGDTDEIIAYKELRAKYITEEPGKEETP